MCLIQRGIQNPAITHTALVRIAVMRHLPHRWHQRRACLLVREGLAFRLREMRTGILPRKAHAKARRKEILMRQHRIAHLHLNHRHRHQRILCCPLEDHTRTTLTLLRRDPRRIGAIANLPRLSCHPPPRRQRLKGQEHSVRSASFSMQTMPTPPSEPETISCSAVHTLHFRRIMYLYRIAIARFNAPTRDVSVLRGKVPPCGTCFICAALGVPPRRPSLHSFACDPHELICALRICACVMYGDFRPVRRLVGHFGGM